MARFNVRSVLSQLGLAGGGGGGGIPNPIPDLYRVQWGTAFGPQGSWGWTLSDPRALDLAGEDYTGGGGANGRSSDLAISTGDATINDAAAGGRSGAILIVTGAADDSDAFGTGADSGQIGLITGPVTNTGGGVPGTSGALLFASGPAADDCESGPVMFTSGTADGVNPSGDLSMLSGSQLGSGTTGDADYGSGRNFGTGDTGPAYVYTGRTVDGDSGWLEVYTGLAGGTGKMSGGLFLYSGNSIDGPTGSAEFYTGDSGGVGNNSGNLRVYTGRPGDADSGAIDVFTGRVTGAGRFSGELSIASGDSSAGQSGNVNIAPGLASSAAGVRGQVRLGSDDAVPGEEPGRLQVRDPLPLDLLGSDVSDRIVLRKQWIQEVQVFGGIAYGVDPAWEAFAVGAGFGVPGVLGLGVPISAGPGDLTTIAPSTVHPNTWRTIDWRGDKETTMRGAFRTPADVSDLDLEWGIRATVIAYDTATDADKMILRYDSGASPNWLVVTSDGGVTVVWDTGIAVVPERTYAFVLRSLLATRVCECFIDGIDRSPPGQTVGAIDLGVPYSGGKQHVAISRTLWIGNWAVSRNFY